jgi:hypothetical protein
MGCRPVRSSFSALRLNSTDNSSRAVFTYHSLASLIRSKHSVDSARYSFGVGMLKSPLSLSKGRMNRVGFRSKEDFCDRYKSGPWRCDPKSTDRGLARQVKCAASYFCRTTISIFNCSRRYFRRRSEFLHQASSHRSRSQSSNARAAVRPFLMCCRVGAAPPQLREMLRRRRPYVEGPQVFGP